MKNPQLRKRDLLSLLAFLLGFGLSPLRSDSAKTLYTPRVTLIPGIYTRTEVDMSGIYIARLATLEYNKSIKTVLLK
ncbi:hypothetical protein ACFL45_07865 [Candidatus Neomarinimicrobiota bacterium]